MITNSFRLFQKGPTYALYKSLFSVISPFFFSLPILYPCQISPTIYKKIANLIYSVLLFMYTGSVLARFLMKKYMYASFTGRYQVGLRPAQIWAIDGLFPGGGRGGAVGDTNTKCQGLQAVSGRSNIQGASEPTYRE